MSEQTRVVLIGGGEHAQVVADAIASRPENGTLVGFLDPQPCAELQALGIRWLGGDDDEVVLSMQDCHFVLAVGGVGNTILRTQLASRYQAIGVHWGQVVHARSVVSKRATLGMGVVVLAGAVVNVGARVGDHAIVNSNAVIEHDVKLGNHVHVGPSATIGGGTEVETNSIIGLGACVRDHIRIGEQAVIGMGAVVVKSVPNRVVVAGVPAEIIRRNE